jgi:hypothetical protein
MAKPKAETKSEEQKKLQTLKIELLKNTLKRKGIKKEIARLITKHISKKSENTGEKQ